MNARTLPLLSLILLGCGGSTASLGPGPGGDGGTADSGGRDASPTSDGGGGPDGAPSPPSWSPLCPAVLPAIGSACTDEDLECEYGDSWWSISCDPVVQCQGGQWTTYQASYDPCSPEPGPNSSACPASYADVDQGSSCSDTSLSCLYAEAICSCQQPLGGPVEIDGGEYASWGCVPEPGCPMPRPRVGAACSDEGTSCTYSECDYAQMCQNGVWQAEEEGCAGAGSGSGGGP
jgi:hypothetical protein